MSLEKLKEAIEARKASMEEKNTLIAQAKELGMSEKEINEFLGVKEEEKKSQGSKEDKSEKQENNEPEEQKNSQQEDKVSEALNKFTKALEDFKKEPQKEEEPEEEPSIYA